MKLRIISLVISLIAPIHIDLFSQSKMPNIQEVIKKFASQSQSLLLKDQLDTFMYYQNELNMIDWEVYNKYTNLPADGLATTQKQRHYLESLMHVVDAERLFYTNTSSTLDQIRVRNSMITSAISYIASIDAEIAQLDLQLAFQPEFRITGSGSSSKTNYQLFKEMNENLIKLSTFYSKLNGYSGKSTFSYLSNQKLDDGANTSNDEYQVSIGTNIKKGVYPGEFEFKGNFVLSLKENQIKEQISDIDISYDLDLIRKKQTFQIEGFGFFNRYSNTYLNIDQRYLSGIGIIPEFYFGGLTNDGTATEKELMRIKLSNGDKDKIIICSGKLCSVNKSLSKIDSNDVNVYNAYKKDVDLLNLKERSKFRFGALIGFVFETEQVSIPDSIELSSARKIVTPFTITPSQRLRWEIRPFFEIRFNDQLTWSFKPYFIFPLDNQEEIFSIDNVVQAKEDWRLDLRTGITYNDKSHVSLSFDVQYNYDNLPAFKRFEVDGIEELYFAPAKHLMTKVSFTYTFK